MKKTILGLDLGTNSIGWALVDSDSNQLINANSRIIPMSQDIIGNYEGGNSHSQTAERTGYRGTRHLRERELLRRERLHRVLKILGFLPKHFDEAINDYGKFVEGTEIKLPYQQTETGNQFLFLSSFQEMVDDFKKNQPQLFYTKPNRQETKIPYDWTIYYLRRKALTEKVEKEELAWLILHFNQKRGYYQLRGEDEETKTNKLEEFHSLKIMDVKATENSKGDEIWYNVHLENGWIYPRKSKTPIADWVGKTRDFIVSTELDEEGNIKKDKDGKEKRSFRSPKEDDWGLQKKKTENEINSKIQKNNSFTVGMYIYENLLSNPTVKVKGKLIRTIERDFYKNELIQILNKQIEFHEELRDNKKYSACINSLYPNNLAHQSNISNKGFLYLFVDDVLFYQRPLKSKKSQIDDCKLELGTTYVKNGREEKVVIKCIPKSHPLYQEFRIWQWIGNLRLYERNKTINDKIVVDEDVTQVYLKNEDDYENLFNFLNDRKDIDQKSLLKFFKLNNKSHRWNYMDTEDNKKNYPCNIIRNSILNRLEKVKNVPKGFLTEDIIFGLWHILYSVDDKIEIVSALAKFASKYQLDESFVEAFKKAPQFEKSYGSLSFKAISKLLPLMRCGKYWNEDKIDIKTKHRIEKIINGEHDEQIKNRVRDQIQKNNLQRISDFKLLPLWLASYVVYDKHSEKDSTKWNSPEDIRNFLRNEFKQHALRNPIVEQITSETLRVVADIWDKYGNGVSDFFGKIKIELGRELKNTKDERKRITEHVFKNENTNLRIKALLQEFSNDQTIANVRPNSPYQADILKIYEEYVLQNNEKYDTEHDQWVTSPITDEIEKISKLPNPTSSQITKYKLWMEQRYRSPYTGNVIPLSKLFTSDYEIEHIIPKSMYLDDSMGNKVICEAAINKLKDNDLAYNFIGNNENRIEIIHGKKVRIFSLEEYKSFLEEHYKSNRTKYKNLLREEIPNQMIDRQLNDTRYISANILRLLSNVVREKEEIEAKSKHVVATSGSITSILKNDWGLNAIWNELITPRFKRMNELTNSNSYGKVNPNTGKFLPELPLIHQKGFNKKRIDHRHHALDAIVIAYTDLNHINYLNNIHAKGKDKNTQERLEVFYGLRKKVCRKVGERPNEKWVVIPPTETLAENAREILEQCIVSFKQNTRVINKASNYYTTYYHGKKIQVKQEGINWAIRKAMHKETVYGKVELRNVKLAKNKSFTAVRKLVDTSFDLKTIETSITDSGIKKILRNYLHAKGGNPEIAFTPEGMEDLNANIALYNDGVKHKPIIKVRIFEEGNKFILGTKHNKSKKFVEAQKGTNLFFAIYEKEGKRNYVSIPLHEVIEHQKQEAHLPKSQRTTIPIDSSKGNFLFYLSPHDLVYIPTSEEKDSNASMNHTNLNKEQIKRIYKMVSCTGVQCMFLPAIISSPIVNKVEFSSSNKMEKTIWGETIKDSCIKLKIDRLGHIIP